MPGSELVIKNMYGWANMKKAGLEALAETTGKAMEADARIEARWQNRTGNARQGLKGGKHIEGQDIFSYIAHSVDYGMWLELANDGKYSILVETRDKFKNSVHQAAERLMKT